MPGKKKNVLNNGKPISEDERRKRSFKHLMLYGIKMTVRRDIGGQNDVENLPEAIGRQFVGKTAEEAGFETAAMLFRLKNGIKERQSRTVEEIERRIAVLRDLLEGEPTRDELIAAIDEVVFGKGYELDETPTPLEHVLR
jgi:hypothetical protein